GERPAYLQCSIICTQTILGLRHIGRGVDVEHLHIIRHRLEPVREAGRNEEASCILAGEQLAMPLPIGGRTGADINGNIENLAAQASDEFRFLMRRVLKMHPAHRAALCCPRPVQLGNAPLPARFSQFIRTEETLQPAALISHAFACDENEPIKRRRRHVEARGHQTYPRCSASKAAIWRSVISLISLPSPSARYHSASHSMQGSPAS